MKKRFCLLLAFIAVSLLAGCTAESAQSDQNNPGQNNPVPNPSFDQNKISREVVTGNSRFAFDIFKQLDKEDREQNILISPLSLSTALSMTYQGAGVTTKEAMAGALGYTGIEDAKLNESYQNLIPYLIGLDEKVELNISNSLWVREGEEIKQDFLIATKDSFNASLTPLDFGKANAADQINQWVSEATNKKIDKIISSPIPSDVIGRADEY